ncbi:hypothetical protein NGRA_0547 [Nosema granulosis]|uniref:Uncharacterized protein n=1 Tax=Nosema granulosis TaxID=83296 RepID=A0A9P6H164_9MICR|nr:hypothetical protein NGRA_0547 [Nosema granulosis]
MINLLFYLSIVAGEDTPPESGTIGFVVPSFSLGTGGMCYSIIFALECFSFVSFVVLPKKNLSGLQTQAVIFQGILIGVDHVLTSCVLGFGEGLIFYLALFSAPACAVLSVNDKFRNLFLSVINAYGTTYLLSILLRLSLLMTAVVGIIFYFVFLFAIKKYELLETVMGKIYTATLSTIVLVDIWGYWSIMKPLHGATNGTTSLVISIILALGILTVVSGAVVLPTYYEEWTNKKLGKTNQEAPAAE